MRLEGPSPFVGREAELASIDRAVARARAGISALVTVVGEGGMGKTRLIEEALNRAEGFTVAWGAGWPEAGAPPLWPWQAVLEQLGASAAVELLDQGEETTERDRFARFRAVSQHVAREEPLAIVLDDAHHVDVAALLLARFVVRTLRTTPLLILVAARPVEGATGQTLADVSGDGIRIDLAGLDLADIGALAASAGVGGAEGLGPALHALTAGNPFLINDALAGSGNELAVLQRAGRRLEARLAGLHPRVIAVLGAAAILGPAADTALVTRVADLDDANVDRARATALQHGMLKPPPAPPFTFVHDLLREAVFERLTPPELAALHGRAADVLAAAARSPFERVARIAHHRVAAADVTDADAVASAVDACRTAARVYLDGLAYEAAASVLSDACSLLGRAGQIVPPDLLVAHARAELAGGRLAAARTSFVAALQSTGPIEPATLADAALGLGGIWVAEHRAVETWSRYRALLDRARLELGNAQPELRVRLDARIAAEALYAGEHDNLVVMHAAVAAARILDDPEPLAESLSLLHHVILGPAYTDDRLRTAEELISVASTAGDAVLTLMGVMWRTVDLLLAGDPAAERALVELRQRADALRVEAVLFVVDVIDVMRAIRAGRLEEAEEGAGRALERGLAVGDADAVNYYAAHLFAIRWLQDRSADVLPLARDAMEGSTVVKGDRTFAAAFAALAVDAGGPALEEAQRQLDVLVEDGLDTLPSSSNWLVTMFSVVEAAAVLGDHRAAEAAYDLLLPHADLPVMASVAVACFGPAALVLGKAAMTLGRVDEAIGHFEHAEGVARRIGNRPYLALTRGELGLALLERGRPADAERAQPLLDEADATLRRLGLEGRADRLAVRASHAAPRTVMTAGRCRFVDGAWELEVDGERARVADGVGMRYLAQLLAAPGHDFAADGLAGAAVDTASSQELLDETAVRSYRNRVEELRADIADAEDDADLERAARHRIELDQLTEHIEAQLGLGYRSRTFADSRERARTSVQKAIRRSLASVAGQAPLLGELLSRSIRTGLVCRFEPVAELPDRWDVAGPERS